MSVYLELFHLYTAIVTATEGHKGARQRRVIGQVARLKDLTGN